MGGLLGSGNAPTNAPIHYSGLNVGTSQLNLPVPIFWGTRRLTTNAMAFANFQSHPVSGKGGGKGGGGKSQQQYTYTADVLLGLCEGPIDSIQNIWSNGSTTTTTTLSYLNMTFFSGTLGQAAWSYWSTNYSTLQQGYSQTAYLGAVNLQLGESATIPDNNFECIRAMGFSYTRTGTSAGWINPNSYAQSSATDVLLSDVITDFLTNVQYGAFMVSGDLGPMTQFATYQRAQGIFVSPYLVSQEKVTDTLTRWAQISNSWIFWSGVQLEFVPLADAAITGNGVTFTPANDVAYTLTLGDLIAAPNEPPVKVNRKDPADCYNRTSVNICDRTLGYIDNPIQWYDDYLIDTYGLRDNTSVSADEICDPAVGTVVAQLLGKRAAYIRNTYQFKTGWPFMLCLPGTVLQIPLNFTGQTLRVRVTAISRDDQGVFTFEAEEFPGTAGTYVAPLNTPAVSTTLVPNQLATPGSVNTPAIVEPPATFTGGQAKLLVAASGSVNWGGAYVYVSFDGTDYVQVGTIMAPAPQGLLTAALAAFGGTNPDTTDTLAVNCAQSLTVPQQVRTADADALRTLSVIAAQPTASGGAQVMPTNGELLAFGTVTATGTYTANLTYLQRGQYGTTAGAHAIGDQFTLLDVLGVNGTTVSYALPAAYIGKPIWIKLASFNQFGQQVQPLSSCTAYKYTPIGAGYGAGTAGVPLTPTGLAVGISTGQVALSWNANAVSDNVTAYQIWRAAGTGAAFGSATKLWSGLALNWIDTTINASTGYTYFLVAVNAVGSSPNSSGVNATTTSTSGAATTAVTASTATTALGTPSGLNWYVDVTNTSGGAITIKLPASPAANQIVHVTDIAGTAGTNAMTITDSSGTALTPAASIAVNYGWLTVRWSGSQWVQA